MDRREALKKSAFGALLLGLGKVLGGEKAEAEEAELIDGEGESTLPDAGDPFWTCDYCGARTTTVFEQADGSKGCCWCTPIATASANPWYFAGYDPGVTIGTCTNVGSYSWNEATFSAAMDAAEQHSAEAL